MKRAILVMGVVAALVGAVPAAALGATSEVSAFGCFNQGGNVTRPAGTEIVVRQGVSLGTKGLAQDFLQAQTTTVTVNGGGPVDISGLYSSPQLMLDGSWLTFVLYPTGITLGTGASMTFHFLLTVRNPIPQVSPGEGTKPVLVEPGTLLEVTCTVTGV
jgi:hypothetical protein